jgi:hypothetical protein
VKNNKILDGRLLIKKIIKDKIKVQIRSDSVGVQRQAQPCGQLARKAFDFQNLDVSSCLSIYTPLNVEARMLSFVE